MNEKEAAYIACSLLLLLVLVLVLVLLLLLLLLLLLHAHKLWKAVQMYVCEKKKISGRGYREHGGDQKRVRATETSKQTHSN